jgi:hypothetical protein
MHDPSIAPRLPLAGLRHRNARTLDRPSFAPPPAGLRRKMHDPSIAPRFPLAGLRRKNARTLDRPSFSTRRAKAQKCTNPRSPLVCPSPG